MQTTMFTFIERNNLRLNKIWIRQFSDFLILFTYKSDYDMYVYQLSLNNFTPHSAKTWIYKIPTKFFLPRVKMVGTDHSESFNLKILVVLLQEFKSNMNFYHNSFKCRSTKFHTGVLQSFILGIVKSL